MASREWVVLVVLSATLLSGCFAPADQASDADEARASPVASAVKQSEARLAPAPEIPEPQAVAVPNTETAILDAQLQAELERVELAAAMARATHEKEERDRLEGKTFNEANIGWSFACDQSRHGISMLGPERLATLTYDQKSSVCSCVKEEVPNNIDLILESPSRSLAEATGGDALNAQVNAFHDCYGRVSALMGATN